MIKKLDWDSAFLGKEVGTYEIQSETLELDISFEKFDLIYLFADKPIKASELLIQYYSIKLIGKKATYYKQLSQVPYLDPNINLLDIKHVPDQRLIDIAAQSGSYSRFHVDPQFPDIKFKELYQLWLLNSINRSIAEKVFVFKVDGIIAGLITAGLKNGIPEIGLLAVDVDFRGQGIGQKLMAAVEHWSIVEKCLNKLQVITQTANKAACHFYETAGFNLQRKQFVYHIWKYK
jgi:dTDP-4-amino-4,6-dideoxy-D-galactose acyltransferase